LDTQVDVVDDVEDPEHANDDKYDEVLRSLVDQGIPEFNIGVSDHPEHTRHRLSNTHLESLGQVVNHETQDHDDDEVHENQRP
jgi:hypothetical protein